MGEREKLGGLSHDEVMLERKGNWSFLSTHREEIKGRGNYELVLLANALSVSDAGFVRALLPISTDGAARASGIPISGRGRWGASGLG